VVTADCNGGVEPEAVDLPEPDCYWYKARGCCSYGEAAEVSIKFTDSAVAAQAGEEAGAGTGCIVESKCMEILVSGGCVRAKFVQRLFVFYKHIHQTMTDRPLCPSSTRVQVPYLQLSRGVVSLRPRANLRSDANVPTQMWRSVGLFFPRLVVVHLCEPHKTRGQVSR